MINLYDDILDMIECVENLHESSEKKLSEKDYKELCDSAGGLLERLGEENFSDEDLKNNGPELREFINSLRTLKDESNQDYLDEEIVKLAYFTSLKHAPYVLKQLVDFYLLNGPIIPKKFR